MQVIRTIFWVLLFVCLLAFSVFNWTPVEVTIWENLIVETKVPALVIIAFLFGMVPTWLLHRGTKWRLNRRIKTLENAAKAAAVTPSADAAGVVSSKPVPTPAADLPSTPQSEPKTL